MVMIGCAAPVDIPLPKDHPAYGFYQTANAFNVSSQECSKLKGSLEIRPDKIGPGREYEKVKEFAPGLFWVKQKATQRQFVTVLFMEYGLVTSLPRTCSWDTATFPYENVARDS
jgi:hypothetical protein